MTGRDQFFLMHLNATDQVDSYEVFEADTEVAAMARAQGTLSSGYAAVEVWNHGQLVGRVGRNDQSASKISKQRGTP